MTQCRAHCLGILNKSGAVYLEELVKDKIKTALTELERERGWSPRTYDSWLVDFKTCMHFCVEKRYLQNDPTQGIKKKERNERRRVRRTLKPEELVRLITAAFNSTKTIVGMTGPMRVLLYTVAALSGWRWSELRKLQRREVYLNEEIPYIAPVAEKQKSKRSDIVVLRSDVMELLRGHFAITPLPPDASAFKMPVGNESGEMIAYDLRHTGDTPEAAAEKQERGEESLAPIPVLDDHGRIVDFHALRHTLATMLDRAGVPLGVRHQIMRHRADKSLTLATYTHSDFMDQKEALDSLPDLIPAEVRAYFTKARNETGTEPSCQNRAKNDATYCPLLPNSASDCALGKKTNTNAASA